jgi:hypothetical protein
MKSGFNSLMMCIKKRDFVKLTGKRDAVELIG